MLAERAGECDFIYLFISDRHLGFFFFLTEREKNPPRHKARRALNTETEYREAEPLSGGKERINIAWAMLMKRTGTGSPACCLPPSFSLPCHSHQNRYSSHQHQHQQQPRLAALAPLHCLCRPLPGSFWQCCAVISHLVLHAATTPSSIALSLSLSHPKSPVFLSLGCMLTFLFRIPVSRPVNPPNPPPPRIRRRFRSGTIRFIVSYNTVIKVVYSHGKSNHGDDQRRAGSPAHPLTTVRTEAVWLPSKLQR